MSDDGMTGAGVTTAASVRPSVCPTARRVPATAMTAAMAPATVSAASMLGGCRRGSERYCCRGNDDGRFDW